MNRVLFLAAVVHLAIAASCAEAQRGGRGGEQDAAKHGWGFSLAEGKAQAAKSNLPLMVVIRCVP